MRNAIRRLAGITIAVICCLAGTWPVAPYTAQAVQERPHCKVCRRFTDTSPSRIQAIIRSGDRQRTYELCSVFCFCELMEDYDDDQLRNVYMLDYTTVDDELPRMIRVKYATFLYGTGGDEKKSREPYVLAFNEHEDAKAAMEELSGELMEWDEILKHCSKLAAEWEPGEPERDVKPLTKR